MNVRARYDMAWSVHNSIETFPASFRLEVHNSSEFQRVKERIAGLYSALAPQPPDF